MNSSRVVLICPLAAVLAVLLLGAPAGQAGVTTVFTVDSTANTGDASPDGACNTCTLREAIQEANFVGGATINFNIPGTQSGCSGPVEPVCTIAPNMPLPAITSPVTIDGYSASGSSENTNQITAGSNAVLKIELNGAGAGMNVHGLTLAGGSSTVRGLVINGFATGIGISIEPPSSGNHIIGNFIGTNVSGTAAADNGFGVGVASNGNTIGGSANADRNVISGNNFNGVEITASGLGGSSNNVVQGNLIGTDASGSVDLGNLQMGVWIHSGSFNNTVGGTMPGEGNVISANTGSGVSIWDAGSTGNSVLGNLIGTAADGDTAMGNGNWGVDVAISANNNTIGGVAAGAGNTITFNGLDGVSVAPGVGSPPSGITIRGNSIHDNGDKGIDKQPDGSEVPPPPVMYGLGSAAGTACANCTVDIYSDNADEGQIYHGSAVASASGKWFFAGVVAGPNVTATATDAGGNTSEFSLPCSDTDADLMCNSGDPCPAVADCDGDGWMDGSEANFIGTDPLDACPDNTSDDAWPADIDNDGFSDITDITFLTGTFGSAVPPAPARYDIAEPPDGFVDISDITRLTGVFGQGCGP